MSEPTWYAEMRAAEAAHLEADLTNLYIAIWEHTKKKPPEFAEAYALLDPESSDVRILWRRAKLCNDLADTAQQDGDKAGRADWLRRGLDHATKAVEADGDSFSAHMW